MSVWAISDLHLSFSLPRNKSMEVFGAEWKDYENKIQDHWKHLISPEDLVLLAGDLSWAMKPEEVLPHLQWIDRLPGTKLLVKGNHDYWWPSPTKLRELLPSSIHFLHRNAFHWKKISIGGARLWDSREFSFDQEIEIKENPYLRSSFEPIDDKEKDEKIYQRELEHLSTSLSQLNPNASIRIAMTHYPPIGAALKPSRASALLEHFRIDFSIFGHLHSVRKNLSLFGTKEGVKYVLTSSDFLKFVPLKILEVP